MRDFGCGLLGLWFAGCVVSGGCDSFATLEVCGIVREPLGLGSFDLFCFMVFGVLVGFEVGRVDWLVC